MALTMSDICDLPILKNAFIHTGHNKLDQQHVEWVSIIETPVESFVRENELVLTSGISCKDDQLTQFVLDIIKARASALAIAVGPYVKKIPPSIIKLATKHDFIIIELEWSLRFSDILKEIIEEMNGLKNHYLEKVEFIRKTLLDCILSGQSLERVAHHVADSIDCDVLIADKRGFIRGSSTREDSDLIESWTVVLREQLKTDGIHQTVENVFFWLPYNRGHALQLTIQSGGNIQGYIIIGGFGEEPFTETEQKDWEMLLEHVTTAVAIHFLHEQAAKEAEWRLRDDFVWELSQGSLKDQENLLSRAKSLGYQINLPYTCLVARPENVKKSFDLTPHLSISYDHWLHECIRFIEEEAESIAKSMALKSMVTYQQSDCIIFLEMTQRNAVDLVKTYIEKFMNRIQLLYPTLSFTWGIAKQSGYSCFDTNFHEAKRALEIGRKRKGIESISIFADTKIDRVLENLVQNHELHEIACSLLDSLIRYSKERQIDLLHTFITYHRNRSNVSQTARDLNLHRQSLLYRLRKIEALTNCSLENADDLFLLDLSIRLWLNQSNEHETK